MWDDNYDYSPKVSSYSKNLQKYLDFYKKKASSYYIINEVDTKMMFIQMANSFKLLRDAVEDCYVDALMARCTDVGIDLLASIQATGTTTEEKTALKNKFEPLITNVEVKEADVNSHTTQIITKCHIKRELELARWENTIIADLDNYSKRKDILSDRHLETLFGEGLYDKTMKISDVLTIYLIPQIKTECSALIVDKDMMLTKESDLKKEVDAYLNTFTDKPVAIINKMAEHVQIVNQIASKSLKLKQSAYLQIKTEDVKYKTMTTKPDPHNNKSDTYWKYLLKGKLIDGTTDNDIADCYKQFSHDVRKRQYDHICDHHAEGFYKYYVRTFIRQPNTNKLDPDFLYMYQTRASSDTVKLTTITPVVKSESPTT